jgi:GNAT superfamily N-acetyltransferase
MIKQIAFEDIYNIWKYELWPNRTSDITSTSAMIFLGGYNIESMKNKPTFLAYGLDNKIVGVNSGHLCFDNSYRSRGLFVFPEYRKRGIGSKLLIETINQGKKENASFVWSYPKLTSWSTYAKAGFTLASDWGKSELGLNAYCQIKV